ncbi:MAG: carbamate kinase [Humibacillus sp.]|nr:carbamate kinase [Humibacillus sp.]MDN5776242.1 carbamate kinase [Humibacillus sp.]
MRVVVALGGNAMIGPDGSATPQAQNDAISAAMAPVADLVAAGHEVVLTHGNGPQVGNILVKNELAAAVVPPVPLDWCGAQTQATIGFTILDTLEAALAERGLATPVAAIVTRTLVSADDPGFAHPTKPIGRYLPREQAQALVDHGEQWEDRGEHGWRRVVASPDPVEVLETHTLLTLLDAGYVVVAAGGGGIPVARSANGALHGVEAVIDKDLTAALLARAVEADVLVIATDVPNAVIHWGTPTAAPIGRVSLEQAQAYAAAGQFASGSMGPKVEAAMRFVRAGGSWSVITSLAQIAVAIDGEVGTVIEGRAQPRQPSPSAPALPSHER